MQNRNGIREDVDVIVQFDLTMINKINNRYSLRTEYSNHRGLHCANIIPQNLAYSCNNLFFQFYFSFTWHQFFFPQKFSQFLLIPVCLLSAAATTIPVISFPGLTSTATISECPRNKDKQQNNKSIQ